jgi:hypothetical protein
MRPVEESVRIDIAATLAAFQASDATGKSSALPQLCCVFPPR